MTQRFAGFELSQVAGVPLLLRRDDARKTFFVALSWQRPLGDGQAARALLPLLLQHGTQRHRGRPALAQARERLYGASTGFRVGRHCESAVFGIGADAVAGGCLPGRPDQFAAVLDLLREQLLLPRLHGDPEHEELFARERAQALAHVRAIVEDRGRYARQRAVQTACAGEPYGVPDHGGEAAIAAMQSHEPAAMFADFLQRGRAVALLSGALPSDAEARLAELLAALPQRAPAELPPPAPPPPRAKGRTVERLPAQQSKLVLVYRLPPVRDGRALAAVQVALSLWGGGTHSRLFQEVREKRSLCYYASAAGDVDKGIAIVQVGCNAANVAAVTAAVQEQLEALAAGNFAAAELATTVAACQGPLRTIDDSPASRLAFTADQWLRGIDQDPAARIAALDAVAPAEVAAVAASLRLDWEYALLPEATA